MKQIKTKSGNILCVEVPEDTTWWQITENNLGGFITKTLGLSEQFLQYGKSSIILGKQVKNIEYYNPKNFYLSKGKHKIVGKLSELTDKDCEEFVDLTNTGLYKLYNWSEEKVNELGMQPIINSAKESFISLLQSKGIDISKEFLIIKVL